MNTGLHSLVLLLTLLSSSLISAHAEQTHIVVKGDTLYDLGKKFGVHHKEIIAANQLKNSVIYSGQKLKIPTPHTASDQAPVKVPSHTYPAPGSNQRHNAPTPPTIPDEVVPRATIPDPIYSDTRPKIPSVYAKPVASRPISRPKPKGRGRTYPAETSFYVAKQGETVRSVSKKFRVTCWDLRAENNLFFSPLFPGKILKIPSRNPSLGGLF